MEKLLTSLVSKANFKKTNLLTDEHCLAKVKGRSELDNYHFLLPG